VIVRQGNSEQISSLTCLLLPLSLVTMWAPAVGAYVARRVERSGFGDAGLAWGPWQYLVLAWFGPPLLTLFAMLISLPIYPLDLNFSYLREAADRSSQPSVMPVEQAAQHAIMFSLTVGTLFHCLETFGEEFGWRGYLLPRLMQVWGNRSGLLAHGALWGLWHMPVVLLLGQNYPGHPLLGVPMMIVTCLLLGILLAWLRLASGGIMAPTIAHSAINNSGIWPVTFLGKFDPTIAGNLFSPVGWLVLLLAISVLQVSGALPRALRRWEDEAVQQPSPVGMVAALEEEHARQEGATLLDGVESCPDVQRRGELG
jgi:uncharacterized protein